MDLQAKAALVVGGTRGIGRAVAERLARTGRPVVLVGRDARVGDTAREALGRDGADVTFRQLDLTDRPATARLVASLAADGVIDTVVHTADVLSSARHDTDDGIETSFATNYLSRFQINAGLLPVLRANAPARILHIASPRLPSTPLRPGDLPPPAGLDGYAAHGVGQRANDAYTVELGRRLAGTGVAISTMGPGMVATDIRSRGPQTLGMRMFSVLARPFTRRPEDTAAVALDLLARPVDEINGRLFDRNGKVVDPRAWVHDDALRGHLFSRSEELVARGVEPGR